MGSSFDDAPVVHHNDNVGVADSAQAVGNYKG